MDKFNYTQRMEELMAEYNRLMACQYLSNPDVREILSIGDRKIARKNPETKEHEIASVAMATINIPAYNTKPSERYGRGLKIVLNFQGRSVKEIQDLLDNNDEKLIRSIKQKIREHSEKWFKCWSSEIY
jgi:hypothetical protein